jgi:uncharacterized protein DUF2442
MKVKQAEYIEDYKIRVLFSDGVTKMVDFTSFLKHAKHIFLPLKNLNYFKKFTVDGITLSWPNGADFEPELLYDMGNVVRVGQTRKLLRKVSLKPTKIRRKAIRKKWVNA